MKIDRTKLISELAAFANEGSGVVVGAPGIGKSYTLAELRDNLRKHKVLHLILPVERLGTATDSELKVILKREGDFVELLRAAAANTKAPAILIFDGFDAARGENERAGVLRLIQRAVNELRGQWNTIVSVRTFDAKKSRQLLALFPSEPQETNPLNGSCRQFVIPSLCEKEVEQAFDQVAGLRELHSGGTVEFQNLLRVPFNLWLIERVLRAGAKADEFSKVTSEVQLLEMYWDYRVRKASHPEDREFILANITQRMVKSHTLTIRREGIYDPRVKSAWDGLLSDEILAEVNEREACVAFTHNILFDFAVSAHLLESDPARLAAFVAEEPARPLFLRPSLVYHFTRLWHFKRNDFWRIFWCAVQRPEIHFRQIIRLVLPAVIVNEAQSIEDLEPFIVSLIKKEAIANDAVAFLLQALRILQSPKHALWADFIQVTGTHLDQRFAWDAGIIATTLLEAKETLSSKSIEACGEFSRSLLRWAWSRRADNITRQWFERLAGLIAIPLVAKTYYTNTKDSRQLIEGVLQVVGAPDFPIDCIYRLTNEVQHIIPHDPDLVAILYEKVFGYEEKSQEKTNMGTPIMGLISTRSQDYSMCRYSLIQAFPQFLNTRTFPALRGGIRAVQAFVVHDHILRYLKDRKTISDSTTKFEFRGASAFYIEDGSAIWDSTSYPDQEIGIANDIFAWLSNAAKENRTKDVEVFLEIFKNEAYIAFLWSRLLSVGALHSARLGPQLWEVTKTKVFLVESDTLYALCSFLEHAVEFFTKEQRKEIEETVLNLPVGSIGRHKDFLESRRDRLIGCIPEKFLVTSEAAKLRTSLAADSKLQPNVPPFRFSSSFKQYNEDDFLRNQGAKPESPANQEIQKLYQLLKEWADKKDETRIDHLLPTAIALKNLLSKDSQADAPVMRAAWTHLAGFASDAVIRTKSTEPERLRFLREIVLEAAANSDPEPNPQYDSKWDHASWSPAPRNDAAQALPFLAYYGSDQATLSAIKKLANDPVPSVRFLLACELWRLVERSPDLMWSILDEFAKNENNNVVLQGVTVSLWQLINRSKERCFKLIGNLLERLEEESDEDETKARGSLVCMVVDYAVWDDNQWAQDTLARWRGAPLQFAASVATAGHRLVAYIEPQHATLQLERARLLLLAHLDEVAKTLTVLQNANSNVPKEEMQRKWKLLYGVIDQTVMRIYFAMDINPSLRQRKENPLSDTTRKQFFYAALPVLEKVLSFGKQPETGMLLAPTAHHFMELLNGALNYDAKQILRMAADVVCCSKRFNYNLDGMAMKEVVKLVESILADYRDKVQEDSSIINLLEVLDAFVEVGWPDALNLVWRLDEIYR